MPARWVAHKEWDYRSEPRGWEGDGLFAPDATIQPGTRGPPAHRPRWDFSAASAHLTKPIPEVVTRERQRSLACESVSRIPPEFCNLTKHFRMLASVV